MTNFSETRLWEILQGIQGNGTFATSGITDFTLPGLKVKGMEDLAFPLTAGQAKELIRLSKQAPFGKGSQTVTDTSVRNTWEIDASQLSFSNPSWEKKLSDILEAVTENLGLTGHQVKAKLYKLLIYEKGGFFLPHKDSEKEKGMFGTLIIGLPSAHTGGELLIRFEGKEKSVSFASSDTYKMPFTAFYADCEHEVRPITSGYRLCLVYNLILHSDKKVQVSTYTEEIAEMSEIFRRWRQTGTNFPKAIFLSHEYTPENFSIKSLKNHDKPRADALIQAAEAAGFYALPGLVTHYQLGELLENNNYYNRYNSRKNRYWDYDEYDSENVEGKMGEVFERYTHISYWEEHTPGLGEWRFDTEEDLLSIQKVGQGTPSEKFAEGYTGNEGMTMTYWYHYGAIVLWPEELQSKLLVRLSIQLQLEWMKFYLENWQSPAYRSPEQVISLLKEMSDPKLLEETNFDNNYLNIDFSPIAAAFVKLNDKQFLKSVGLPMLKILFSYISVDQWKNILTSFKPKILLPVFRKAGKKGDRKSLLKLLQLLDALSTEKKGAIQKFVMEILDELPDFLQSLPHTNDLPKPKDRNWSKNPQNASEQNQKILMAIFSLYKLKKEEKKWEKKIINSLTEKMERDYIHQVLQKVLFRLSDEEKTGKLYKQLKKHSIHYLEQNVAHQPQAPQDWKKEPPLHFSPYYKNVWDMLSPFLLSPTNQRFDFKSNQQERTKVEFAISQVVIDLKTATIRQGSPHTLVITKTHDSYQREMQKWNEDVTLLEKLNT
ncbi:MAG: 2OG-Fe(II) oxygenase [Bacteroidia bacterium]